MGRIHSRGRLEHGDKVECDVCKASSTDDGTADVKDSVVTIQPVSSLLRFAASALTSTSKHPVADRLDNESATRAIHDGTTTHRHLDRQMSA